MKLSPSIPTNNKYKASSECEGAQNRLAPKATSRLGGKSIFDLMLCA